MSVEIYYFDGSGSCDTCSAATGYCVGERPPRPHPYCDCPIEEIDPAGFEDCDYEFRNLSVEESVDVYVVQLHYDRCDEEEEEEQEAGITDAETYSFDEGLRSFAEEQGWSPPPVETMEWGFVLPPYAETDVYFPVHIYSAHLEAEIWLVCNVDGELVEQFVALATGDYRLKFHVEEPTVEPRLCLEPDDVEV